MEDREYRQNPLSREHKGEETKFFCYFDHPLILPKGQILVVHSLLGVVTLLTIEPVQYPILGQVKLSQNANRVFLAILDAYPYYCPHQELLECLYPQQAFINREEQQEEWEYALKPVYRAVEKINEAVEPLDIKIDVTRGLGYQVVSASSK